MECQLRDGKFPAIICYCTHTAGSLLMDPRTSNCRVVPSYHLSDQINQSRVHFPPPFKAKTPPKPRSLLTLTPPWRRPHVGYMRRFIGINTTQSNARCYDEPSASTTKKQPCSDLQPNHNSTLPNAPLPHSTHKKQNKSKLDTLFDKLGLSSKDYLSTGSNVNIITIKENSEDEDDNPTKSPLKEYSKDDGANMYEETQSPGSILSCKINWRKQLGNVPAPTSMKELADFHRTLIDIHGYGSAAYIMRSARPLMKASNPE